MASSGVGSSVVNFGAFPGSNEATVSVIGQTDIAADALCEAWVTAIPTADHTVSDHAYTANLMRPTCGVATAGNGFTIYCYSPEKLQGPYNINWVWYNPA